MIVLGLGGAVGHDPAAAVVVDMDLTPNLDSLTLQGSGTVQRQGILIPDAGPIDAKLNSYFVRT